MGKCPICGKEITYLIAYETGVKTYEVTLDKATLGEDRDYYYLDFEETDYNPDGIDRYECPECGKEIHEDAVKVLRG